MKRISLILLLALLLPAVLVSCSPKTKDASGRCKQDKYVYLVVGFDEAAENTDVIFTMSYDAKTNTAYVAQIPRDTYYRFGSGQNKINQLYATLVSEGKSSKEALRITSEKIAELFGTKFDGFIGVTVDTFKSVVDSIGGLDIELNDDMTLYLEEEDPIILKKGKNHIDGERAASFVRFRRGYVMGDLGRIDAQKMFLNALFWKLADGVSLPLMFKLANVFQNKIIANIKLLDILALYIDATNSKYEKKVCYVTVPGEPTLNSSGISFYVLNRKSAAEIANKYMYASNPFDSAQLCKNINEPGFALIYDDNSIDYREYTNENLSDLKIIQKIN